MATVVRLVTFVDVDGDVESRTQLNVSARLEAELSDGGRIVLLDDRGWSESVTHTSAAIPDIWTCTSLEDIRATARTVIGPDEGSGEHSEEEMAADHWASLHETLERHRITADAAELRNLPHDVVPSARLLARMGHG